MNRKERVPASHRYRVDHATVGEWFYNESWSTEDDAQKHIDRLNPRYRDKLTIVKYHEPEHDRWHLGTT